MSEQLAQISIYLAKAKAKPNSTFDDVFVAEKIQPEGEDFKIREFSSVDDGFEAKFYCRQVRVSTPDNPHWLDFINEKITDKINFSTKTQRPSGVLLLKIQDRIFAATFGVGAHSWLDKTKFVPDFGIKTAMNMCGNTEVRQVKSATHAYNTQQIYRQNSRPTDTRAFAMRDDEWLKFVSAHLPGDKKITLSGKDSLTIKVIGDEKIDWEKLITRCKEALDHYGKTDYKQSFPEYGMFETVDDETSERLDEILITRLKSKDFANIHLAIPDFIPDDDYSFAYSNNGNGRDICVSFLSTGDLGRRDFTIFNLSGMTVKSLKNKHIYAYSHAESKILPHRKWRYYDCIVTEIQDSGAYYVLSEGTWGKIDADFQKTIDDFINSLTVSTVDTAFHDIDIFDGETNREAIFNEKYAAKDKQTIKFDHAKLRIGTARKDSEFCDMLELDKAGMMKIIHVKRHGGSSSINHLFSQAMLYGEAFIGDQVFLDEIREYIGGDKAQGKDKTAFWDYIPQKLGDNTGQKYSVCLWILHDCKKRVTAQDLPIMAKHQLKICYERLRNICKFSAVELAFVPVIQTQKIKNFPKSKKL